MDMAIDQTRKDAPPLEIKDPIGLGGGKLLALPHEKNRLSLYGNRPFLDHLAISDDDSPVSQYNCHPFPPLSFGIVQVEIFV
jgi:hypothetical protein